MAETMTLAMRLRFDGAAAIAGMGKIKDGLMAVDSAAKRAGNPKMGGLIQSLKEASRWSHDLAGNLTKVAAGATAGFYALNRITQAPLEYDKRLALMANTAFSGRNTAGRIAGKAELDALITGSVRKGGGSRDQAAESLDKLLASGALTMSSAAALLPTLQKYATATGAAASDLADIAIRGKQTFGLTDAQMVEALDKSIAAGQAGGFELRDMAKWLPQQMAAARNAGITGMSGFEDLLAFNQASAITAGSKDEAGNNLVNLLAKVNSNDTAKDAKRLGIDLSGTLARDRAKGINAVDSFVGLVAKISAQDSRLVALRKQASGLKGGDLKANLSAQADILQGNSIGKLVQDRQALMALVGVMNNAGYIAQVREKVAQGAGEGERSFGTVSATGAFKAEQIKNEKDIAMQRVVDAALPTGLMDKVVQSAQEFPRLTTAVVAATGAVAIFAAAVGAGGLAGILTGKGGGKDAGGKAGGLGKFAKAAGAITAAGAGGYAVGTFINDKFISGTKAGDAIGSGIAKTLAFFGNEEAKRAVAVTEKLNSAKVGGTISIKIDSEGRPRVHQVKSSNPRVPINVNTGITMSQW